MTAYLTGTGQVLGGTHGPKLCEGRGCVIHHPSDHHMKDWPTNWRHGGAFDIKPPHMERVCPHGIGHPDPDDVAFLGADVIGVHGCDGCCDPERVSIVLEAFKRGVTPPAPATLAKYGMTAEEWLTLLADQGWKCPICLKDAAEVRLNTDHEHARGWEKMKPEQKKAYTRGILCSYCNYRRVHSTISGEIAQRIADYIGRYEARKA